MNVRMSFPLAGKVCVVTGASRGIGKGIALQLGENGAKVYITGRTLDVQKGTAVPGSLRETADEIEARGGVAVSVQCDHAQDTEVEQLFEKVKRENDGQLDILVNSAFPANATCLRNLGKGFWEQPTSLWDELNHVGLRNNYLCSVYAAKIMVPRKKGLIVNVSSFGGLHYMFNPAYGIGKSALDRMATDCAHELKQHNVAFVSIVPAQVSSESVLSLITEHINNTTVLGYMGYCGRPKEDILKIVKSNESVELSGKCVVALALDKNIMNKSGRSLLTFDLMQSYGLTELQGHSPDDMRQARWVLTRLGFAKWAWLIPSFVRVPRWLLYLTSNKL